MIINKFSNIMVKQMRLFLAAVMLMAAAVVNAQITTSSMAGQVTGTNGEDIIGATIRVTHEPSGTTYNAVTNVDGRWAIQGMRVGGPYTVKVTYIGYAEKDYTGINLALGETYNLNAVISEDVNELGEVVVVGNASKFAAEKTGATTNISNAQIQALPTVSRSIEDIARLSPYANGMSFAGGDGRSSNFTLDGANLNNNFGLNDGLPGGGNPISMDAIDEVQVVVAPYDVRQTNFIGGGINAVTKSGTNTFKGTAYIYYNNENMHGNRVANQDLGERGTDRNTTYGFTLGGPILKDKLFFFANAEYSKIPTVANRWRASEDGVADPENYISRTTIADMEKVRNFLIDKYGYDPGSYTSFPADEDNLKLLARVDWNINNNHHLAVRYNYTKNTAWNAVNGSSCDTGKRLSYNRLSQYSMAFSNSMYSQNNSVSTISADLNSRFGNNISNQLLFTYTNIDEKRGSDSSPFPFVDIMGGYETAADGTVTQSLTPYMSFGYELFTHNNRVQNKILTLNDNFTYYLGDHKLMAGIRFEHQLANNSYMRGGTGYYRYRSLDDFLNGAAPETVGLAYGYNGETNPNAEVSFNQYGWYVQDEWNALSNLKITGGIRFDLISFDSDDLMRNNAIYNLDFGGRRIDTGTWPDGNVQISPRVGFTWDVFNDKRLKVRGGTGLFAGRLPLVFFTNMPTNSGMVQNLFHADTNYNDDGTVYSRNPLLDKFKGGLVTDVNQMRELLGQPESITPDKGTVPSEIAGVDKNFKMPQVWKTSIAVDYQFPVSFPLTLSGEFTYIKKINDVRLDNYNIKPIDGYEQFAGADNRYIYPDADSRRYYKDFTNACVLTNTHKGHGWTLNFTATAEPIKDLHLMAAYTHTVMKEVSGMPGSNATSAWTNLYTVNGPNHATVQNSEYVIPDRVIASASYRYHKDQFTLLYTGYRPSGYSFAYEGDMNGDGTSNDLMYIPKDDSEIHFTNEADRQLFWNFVNQDSYLKNHKGEYAEAYSAFAPWVHRFDFRWTHDFTLKVGKTQHTLQLIANIMNVGNLFNSKWGVEKNMSNCNNGRFLKYDGRDANNVPYFSMYRGPKGDQPVATSTWSFNRNYDQCWKMQIGVKYYFN